MQATAKEEKLPPVKKGKKNFSVFPFVNGLFFLLFCLFILVPLWKVLVDSLDLPTGYGIKLWPENFGLAGYQSVFSHPTLLRPLMISVVTTVACTFLGLFLSTVGAYVLIQLDIPGRNFFAGIMLFTMIFQGGMIPSYLVMKNLHLTNTLGVAILMPAINIYNLVLIRNFFEGIPTSLFESATLDGCSPIQIFYKIVLPLSKPIIVYTVINSFLAPWMDFVFADLMMTSGTAANKTVALGLFTMVHKVNRNNYFAQFCAGGVIVSIPISVQFIIMQKFYGEGITGGSVKG